MVELAFGAGRSMCRKATEAPIRKSDSLSASKPPRHRLTKTYSVTSRYADSKQSHICADAASLFPVGDASVRASGASVASGRRKPPSILGTPASNDDEAKIYGEYVPGTYRCRCTGVVAVPRGLLESHRAVVPRGGHQVAREDQRAGGSWCRRKSRQEPRRPSEAPGAPGE